MRYCRAEPVGAVTSDPTAWQGVTHPYTAPYGRTARRVYNAQHISTRAQKRKRPMSRTQPHHHFPGKSDTALLIVDVINDFQFPGGDQLAEFALPMAERIAALKRRATAAGVPTIYANDNFGRWQSNFDKQVRELLRGESRGKPVVELLKPSRKDYFILKPRHSAFYLTPLDTLLQQIEAKTLIVTGVAGDFCVLFTANDAYMRGYRVVVPCDCIASNTEEYNAQALDLMQRLLKAETPPSTALALK